MYPKKYYLELRNKFLPKSLETVFILESPPISGLYFYDTSGSTGEPLFTAMMNLFNQKPIENAIVKGEENEETEEKIIHVLDEETLEESINEEIQEETYEEQIVDDTQSINDIEVIDFTHVIDKEEFFEENNVEEVSDVELEENNSINWSLFEQDKAEVILLATGLGSANRHKACFPQSGKTARRNSGFRL